MSMRVSMSVTTRNSPQTPQMGTQLSFVVTWSSFMPWPVYPQEVPPPAPSTLCPRGTSGNL